MVLHGENRVLPVAHALHRAVIEVQVGDLERRGAWDVLPLAAHREAMVLRRYKYLSRSNIAHGVVATPVAIRQLDRLSAQRQAEQLMAEADTEYRDLPIGQLADRADRVPDGGGVARAVREEDAVGLELAHPGRGRRGRDDRHAAVVLREQAEDVALHAVVVRHDVIPRLRRSLDVLPLDRGATREVEPVHRRAGGERRAHVVGRLLAGGRDPAHRAARADVTRELAGVHVGDEGHLRAGQPLGEGAGGAPVRRLDRQFPYYDAGHARPVRFDIVGVDAVVPDHRRGHDDELAEIGGVGEDLLVAGQVRREHDLGVRGLEIEGRGTAEQGAVLEEHVRRARARDGWWGSG